MVPMSSASLVRAKTFSAHVAFNFGHDVRGKRFNTHGKLHCMEMIISKDHVAEKPRRGASKGDINITMITSGANCRDAATGRFVTD